MISRPKQLTPLDKNIGNLLITYHEKVHNKEEKEKDEETKPEEKAIEEETRPTEEEDNSFTYYKTFYIKLNRCSQRKKNP